MLHPWGLPPGQGGIPIEGLGPVYRGGQDMGRTLLAHLRPERGPSLAQRHPEPPCPPVSPALPSNPAHSRGDALCAYQVTWSDVCLETFSVPSGQFFHANTRPIQPGSHPQAIGSQWDHSCSQNRPHARAVPLAAAGLALLRPSSPSRLSVHTYSTSREVRRPPVNINNGNIKAPLQVRDRKWYFCLLLSICLIHQMH